MDLIAGRPRELASASGAMAVDLCDGYRLVFESNHPGRRPAQSSPIDWSQVWRVKMLGIERSHD